MLFSFTVICKKEKITVNIDLIFFLQSPLKRLIISLGVCNIQETPWHREQKFRTKKDRIIRAL